MSQLSFELREKIAMEAFPKPRMTPLQKAICDILQEHQGRENGIKAEAIIKELILITGERIDKRELANEIKILVEIHELLIGSTTSKGYFFIKDIEDLMFSTMHLDNKGCSCLSRARILRRLYNEKHNNQQKLRFSND